MPDASLPLTPAEIATEPAASEPVFDDPDELRRFTRFTSGADGRRVADSSLRIEGIHCAACAGLIEAAVAPLAGVRAVRVSAAAERARIEWCPDETTLARVVQAIRRAGYDARPDTARDAHESRRLEAQRALWRLFVAALCAMQVMMMATPSYVARADEIAPDLRALLNWGGWLLTLPVLAFSARPLFVGAWRGLRAGRLGMDVPAAVGIAVAFVASTGATFDPGGAFGSDVWFDSLTMFVAFLMAGRWAETQLRHRVERTLEAAADALASTALRVRAAPGVDPAVETFEVVEAVAVARLAPGDRVRVPLGQSFPGDGRVEAGATAADESMLTGEPTPVAKLPGDMVVGGSVNVGAPVVVRLERVGDDTRLAAIVALMREAATQRPASARLADRWSAPFLGTVLALAAGAALWWADVEPSRALPAAVAVLIVTCPCALSLATPAAMLAAAAGLARRGVLLRRLDAIEPLARMTRLFVDKTGTLTEAGGVDVRIVDVRAGPGPADAGCARDDGASLRRRAASLAGWSSHPLAQAVVADRSTGVDDTTIRETDRDFGWHDVREHPGRGIEAVDASGTVWRLGSAAFVGATDARADGSPAVWLGRDGVALARLDVGEALRPDVADAVAQLREGGLDVALLSGDAPARVARLGGWLGIADARGGATPEAKVAAVAAAQSAGDVVGMVGDGVNDAPVLARADVSLALGHGALLARASADAVVVSGRLGDVAAARVLAQRTLRVVRQNLMWAATYNAVSIPLALTGRLPPWAAGLGMAASSLAVVANAARLIR